MSGRAALGIAGLLALCLLAEVAVGAYETSAAGITVRLVVATPTPIPVGPAFPHGAADKHGAE
ncbi:MAG TPA: hypothetical protein VKF59_01045 [Candidatus Dormibacteraeota bacterium]|nr:hypothetical protein [Candidatus Dormibacteraeota bacterium]